MLPAHLTGSYQRYKANTDIFTTWLTHTAAACGYRIPAARKQTAQPASAEVGGPNRFTYPIGEILRQAQAIAGSGYAGMQLPSSIQRSAERAIEGRIALSDVIKTVRQDEAGDESHAVFTGTLKGALEILKQARPNPSTKKPGPESSQVDPLINIFEHLELEDIESDVENLLFEVSTTASEAAVKLHSNKGRKKGSKKPYKRPPAKASQNSTAETYELRDDDQTLARFTDTILNIAGFFFDLHPIEDYVCRVWEAYRDGSHHLCTASLLTNAALALVEEAEKRLNEELVELGIKHVSHSRSHHNFLCLLQFGRAPRPQDGSKLFSNLELARLCYRPSPDEGNTSEFLYLNTFRALMHIMQYIPQLAGAASANGKELLFYPIPRITDQFPTYRDDVIKDANVYLPSELIAKEQVIIRLFNADLSICNLLRFHSKHNHAGSRISFMDEFSKAVLKLESLECPTHVSFAFNMMARVNGILDEAYMRPRKQLFEDIERFMEVTAYTKSDKPRLPFDPHFIVADQAIGLEMQEFGNFLIEGVTKGIFYHAGTEVMDGGGPDGLYVSDPRDMEDFSVLHLSPLFCGTALLNLHVGVEDLGVRLANVHASIIHTAQLYDALRGEGHLPGTWPDMEEVIQVHLLLIFFGSIPATAEQRLKRFQLRSGLPLAELNDVGIAFGTWKKNLRNEQCLEITSASKAFLEMFKGETSTLQTIFTLRSIAEEHLSTGVKGKRKHTNKRPAIGSVLGSLLKSFPAQLGVILIPYLELTKTCSALLGSLINLEPIELPQSVYTDHCYRWNGPMGDSGVRFRNYKQLFSPFVCQILRDDCEGEKIQKKNPGGLIVTRSDLQTVAPLAREAMQALRLLGVTKDDHKSAEVVG